MTAAAKIDILVSEVGPRDGLQSIAAVMPTAAKKAWISAEAAAGVREIEVGSFVPASLLLGAGIPLLAVGTSRRRAYKDAQKALQSRRLMPAVGRTPGGGGLAASLCDFEQGFALGGIESS